MTSPSIDETAAEPSPTPPSRLRRAVYLLGAILLAALAYLLLWPSPVDPVAYEAPPRLPLEGALAPNDRLASAEVLAAGKVNGPEDVEVDEQGRVITGTAEGRIVRVEPDGSLTTLANTHGRPVGIATDAAGNLIVADAIQGLLSVDPEGKLTTLAGGPKDKSIGFADDVAVARDGMIYFSDASSKFGHNEYLYDMLEGRPHGRLLRYDPATKETKELLGDLHFANGVALSQNEDFVLINETYRMRIMRYWLAGERAGKSDVFIEHLPGYPDNITSNGQGTFWLALFTTRNDQADWMAERPFVRGVLAKLPGFLWPKPARYAFVVKLDENGQIIDSLQDPQGKSLYAVTSAFERDGYLYLGSLINDRIGKYKLP